ncbi:MAG: hypothetical protein BWX89_00514 [candidate division TA06 bacterium ADurb.Bin131]|uniref:Uncharacterized protein n=1 Tax=candidate division TA06 bacterium ADurb.Bin131 TaxID=1852827 RepID=A0A1V6CC64_UNCT6|nr:MAG: hypothetical protein BWX89_00514 [candidate division TA06 bacterium ADurb.Bin131]
MTHYVSKLVLKASIKTGYITSYILSLSLKSKQANHKKFFSLCPLLKEKVSTDFEILLIKG